MQHMLPGMDGPMLRQRFILNAKFCRGHAHLYRREGNAKQFHTWMKLAHKSINSARRLIQSGVIHE